MGRRRIPKMTCDPINPRVSSGGKKGGPKELSAGFGAGRRVSPSEPKGIISADSYLKGGVKGLLLPSTSGAGNRDPKLKGSVGG